MREDDILSGTVLGELGYSLEELAQAAAVGEEWLTLRIREGLVEALPGAALPWRFAVSEVRRVRRMRDIERDFDAAPELAALVADLLEELAALRARLRAAGLA
ncbi:MAG: MerR family transcriptional regulator [Burkholderiales bacterium]|nr:MerR family transcriptional regulator [Burkholderiales bacterium]